MELLSENSNFKDKPPENIYKIRDVPTEFNDITNKLYVDTRDALLNTNIV